MSGSTRGGSVYAQRKISLGALHAWRFACLVLNYVTLYYHCPIVAHEGNGMMQTIDVMA